jgi:hypothetical protein
MFELFYFLLWVKLSPPWKALKQYMAKEIWILCVLIFGTSFKEWTTSYLAFVSISGQMLHKKLDENLNCCGRKGLGRVQKS